MKQTILTAKQSVLLENLIAQSGEVVTSDQIYTAAADNWDYQQTKNLVTKLVKNGWLFRIKRGLYAITGLSSRGSLSLSPYVIARLLVKDSYVSFEAALQHFGLFDQLLAQTASVTLKQKSGSRLAGMDYKFIKTQPQLFFGWQEVHFHQQLARIAYPEKALLDLVNFRRSQYAIDLVIEKLIEYQHGLDLTRLGQYLVRFPLTTIKTFGFLFDLLGLDSSQILAAAKKAKTGTFWMVPQASKFNAKWRLYYEPSLDKYRVK
jgi:predicted transcriptional regulator of viral defense system